MYFIDSTIPVFGETVPCPAYVKQVFTAVLFGILIGAERGWHKKLASYRTFAVISAGSCLYTLLSVSANDDPNLNYDVTRVAAQIVTGIGFVGGGVIFKTANHVEGITTAAMIWLAGAIGMACGFNRMGVALAGFLAFLSIEAVAIIVRRIKILMILRLANKGKPKDGAVDG